MSDGRRDLATDAERLRCWLDDLTAALAAPSPPAGLADWHRAHAAAVIAAALALEDLAAPTRPG